jgi:hypothetical protein
MEGWRQGGARTQELTTRREKKNRLASHLIEGVGPPLQGLLGIPLVVLAPESPYM